MGAEKKLSKSFSGYFMTTEEKKSMAIKPEGGGGLNGPAIKRRTLFFLRLP